MSQGKIFKDGKTIFSESLLKCQYKKNCKDHEIFKVDGVQKLDSRTVSRELGSGDGTGEFCRHEFFRNKLNESKSCICDYRRKVYKRETILQFF